MTSTADADRQRSVQVTIEQLRYWVPAIKDVARVYEGDEGQSWLLSIEPHVMSACPIALEIKNDGRLDLAIAGETYENLSLSSLDEIVLLLDRITLGHVVQRRWFSAVTGSPQGVETLVMLGPESIWRGGPPLVNGGVRRDRHFLSYRRG